jgi:polyferredoxin
MKQEKLNPNLSLSHRDNLQIQEQSRMTIPKTPITAKSVFIELTYFLLIVLFSIAGGSKLINHQKFVGEMLNQVFPHWFSWLLIYTLPYYELAIVAAILAGRKLNFKKV